MDDKRSCTQKCSYLGLFMLSDTRNFSKKNCKKPSVTLGMGLGGHLVIIRALKHPWGPT